MGVNVSITNNKQILVWCFGLNLSALDSVSQILHQQMICSRRRNLCWGLPVAVRRGSPEIWPKGPSGPE